MKKLLTGLLVVFLFSGLIFGGFSQAQDEPTITYIEPGTSEAEKARTERISKEINEQFDDLDFQVEYIPWGQLRNKITTRLMAGDAPDMVLQQDFTALARLGAFEPLGDSLEGDPMYDVSEDNFNDALLEYSTMNDELYMLPLAGVAWGLVVREDLLNEEGYSVKDLETWEDFKEIAKALTKDTDGDGDVDQYGYIYDSGAPRYAWREAELVAHSNNVRLENVEANEKKVKEFLSFIKDLKPYTPSGDTAMDLNDAYRAYAQGRVAMMVTGSWFNSNIVTVNKEVMKDTRVVPFPKGPSADEFRVPVNAVGYSMFEKSQNKEKVWKVMNYLTSKEKALSFAAMINLPARTDISPEEFAEASKENYPEVPEANAQIVTDFLEIQNKYGVPRSKLAYGPRIEKEFSGIITNFRQGNLTVGEAYSQLSETLPPLVKN